MTHIVFQNLADASKEARNLNWAATTVSVEIAVNRNGRERDYRFDRKGDCLGVRLGEEFLEFDPVWKARDLAK